MAKFNTADFLRQHGAKLRTRYVADDGAKVTLPGFPGSESAESLVELAEESLEDAPVKVGLAAYLVDGKPVKRAGVVYGHDAADMVAEHFQDTKKPTSVAEQRAAAPAATNGQKAAK